MQQPSKETIDQWCKFISKHLYMCDLIAYRFNSSKLSYHIYTDRKESWCIKMFSDLDANLCGAEYLFNVEKIKELNEYVKEKNAGNQGQDMQIIRDLQVSNKDKYFKQMTNRQYLKWRLKIIEQEQQKPISIKKTIGLAFSSLVGIYWFFTLKTKPSTKILMGILNLFVVAVLICAIVLNLSIYILIPTAIFYGLFVLASCIHIGCKRYKENVKYQEEFGNTYDAIITYLNQAEPQKPLEDKINDREKGQENLSEIKEETKDKINDEHKQT